MKRQLRTSEKMKLLRAIKDLNELIIRYHGIEILESERDDLCNIRWVLENKLKGNIIVENNENYWKSGNKCS